MLWYNQQYSSSDPVRRAGSHDNDKIVPFPFRRLPTPRSSAGVRLVSRAPPSIILFVAVAVVGAWCSLLPLPVVDCGKRGRGAVGMRDRGHELRGDISPRLFAHFPASCTLIFILVFVLHIPPFRRYNIFMAENSHPTVF